jgi:hypothetical protein
MTVQPTSQPTSSGATVEDLQRRIDETVDFINHLHRNNYIGRTERSEILKRLGSDQV